MAAPVIGSAARAGGIEVVKAGKRLWNWMSKRKAQGATTTASVNGARDFISKAVAKVKAASFSTERLKNAARRVGVKAQGKSDDQLKDSVIKRMRSNPMVAAYAVYELMGPDEGLTGWAYENLAGADEALERLEAEKAMDGTSDIPDDDDMTPAERATDVISGFEAKREIYETIGRASASVGGDSRLRELIYVLSLDLTTLDEYFELRAMRTVFR